MPSFIALLRGVNVGKANRVPMAELRRLLEALGYSKVVTLLNSGNAVFHAARGTPARHGTDIAATLLQNLKVDTPVIVKSGRELAAIVEECPIEVPEAEHSRFLVAFTQQTDVLARLDDIAHLVKRPERFVVGKNAAYLHCASGILESKAGAALLGKLGRAATTRNWATVLKLRTLAADPSAGSGRTA
jgi:uncharacterized protein (DUF1697 family)